MKKILISVFGIAAVGFITAYVPNLTKAVAQTVIPEGAMTTCGSQLMCDLNGKPFTGEDSGKYYVMGIEQNEERYGDYVRLTNLTTDLPLNEPLGESLDTSLNQPLDEPLDTSLNQPIGETQDDGSLTGNLDQLQEPGF